MIEENTKSNSIVSILFCLFIFLFTISYTNIPNNTVIRYSAIGILNIIGLYYLLVYKNTNKVNKKILFLIMILVLNMMFSVLFSNFIGESFVKTLSVFDSILLLFILIPNIIKKISFKTIIKAIYIALLIILLYEFAKYKNVYLYDGGGRYSATHSRLILNFLYPSSLGWPGFLLCVSSIYLFDDKHNSMLKKIIYIMSFIFGFYLLYKCDIRTSIYSLFIFIILYILNYKIKNFKTFKFNKIFLNVLIYLTVIAAFIIASLYFFTGHISTEKLNLILSNRLTYYEAALDDLYDGNILYGVGAYRNLNGAEYGIAQIDNSYLNFVYSYGITNLIIFICIIINVIKRIKNKKCYKLSSIKIEKTDAFILSLFISFLIYSFFEITLLNISSLLAIIIWPLTMKYVQLNDNNVKENINQ